MQHRTQLNFIAFTVLFIANLALASASPDKRYKEEQKIQQKALLSDPNKLNDIVVNFLGVDPKTAARELTTRILDQDLQAFDSNVYSKTKDLRIKRIVLHNTSSKHDVEVSYKPQHNKLRTETKKLKAGESLPLGYTQEMMPIIGVKTHSILRSTHDKTAQYTEKVLGYDKDTLFNLNEAILGRLGYTDSIHVHLVDGLTWSLECNNVRITDMLQKMLPLAVSLHNKSSSYDIDVKYRKNGTSEKLSTIRVKTDQRVKLAQKFQNVYPEISIEKVPLLSTALANTVDYFGGFLSSSEGTTSTSNRFNMVTALTEQGKNNVLLGAQTLVVQVYGGIGSQLTLKTTAQTNNKNVQTSPNIELFMTHGTSSLSGNFGQQSPSSHKNK